jgi:hypothetical protein
MMSMKGCAMRERKEKEGKGKERREIERLLTKSNVVGVLRLPIVGREEDGNL